MLIFVKGHYLARIASGQKTTTIRPWKTCKLKPGAVLSFNGKVRTVVTRVEQRRLGDLTDADARADGFDSCREFRRAFREHYPATSADALVWVLTFAPPV
jgi:hypothetical protein